jgi:hypothetical protein
MNATFTPARLDPSQNTTKLTVIDKSTSAMSPTRDTDTTNSAEPPGSTVVDAGWTITITYEQPDTLPHKSANIPTRMTRAMKI